MLKAAEPPEDTHKGGQLGVWIQLCSTQVEVHMVLSHVSCERGAMTALAWPRERKHHKTPKANLSILGKKRWASDSEAQDVHTLRNKRSEWSENWL